MNHITSAVQSIKIFLSKGNRAQLCLFALFTLLIFIKILMFHIDVFHSILLASIFTNPVEFIWFYLIKIIPALFLGSFILLSCRHLWWTIIMSVIIDLWCVANIIYYKTYDMFLTVNDILLVGNMDGAWDSVLGYIDIWIILLIISTILWTIFVLRLPKTKSSVCCKSFLLILVFVCSCATINNVRMYNSYSTQKEKENLDAENQWRKLQRADDPDLILRYSYLIINLPHIRTYYHVRTAPMVSSEQIKNEIRKASILSYIPDLLICYFCEEEIEVGDIKKLSETDVLQLKALFSKVVSTNAACQPTSIIFILVESLESWPIEQTVAGVNVTPFLSSLSKHSNTVYFNRVTSQALKGNSGDGQMIVNTGLLPINNGVACMLYGDNEYPNLGHFYKNNILINPWPHIWNQDTMTVRYGYNCLVEPTAVSLKWDDKEIFNTALDSIKSMQQPFLASIITVSSHTPFYGHDKRLKFDEEVPLLMERYLNCLNYTDSCIESFCNKIWSEPSLANSTIIITGDHTTFKPAMLHEFSDFINQQNLSLKSGENFTSLFICSPKIAENSRMNDVCYQMDIYPTILRLIGCEDYYWKGVGVNLLDSVARKNRKISEEEAYRLSDLLIRSNAFELYKQGKLFDNQNNATAQ